MNALDQPLTIAFSFVVDLVERNVGKVFKRLRVQAQSRATDSSYLRRCNLHPKKFPKLDLTDSPFLPHDKTLLLEPKLPSTGIDSCSLGPRAQNNRSRRQRSFPALLPASTVSASLHAHAHTHAPSPHRDWRCKSISSRQGRTLAWISQILFRCRFMLLWHSRVSCVPSL